MRNLLRAVNDRIRANRDPIGFARSLGVDVADEVRLYGISRGMFGSEPWMIRIHEKVFITAGMTFVTHGGGPLNLRDEVPTLTWSAPICFENMSAVEKDVALRRHYERKGWLREIISPK